MSGVEPRFTCGNEIRGVIDRTDSTRVRRRLRGVPGPSQSSISSCTSNQRSASSMGNFPLAANASGERWARKDKFTTRLGITQGLEPFVQLAHSQIGTLTGAIRVKFTRARVIAAREFPGVDREFFGQVKKLKVVRAVRRRNWIHSRTSASRSDFGTRIPYRLGRR